MQADAVEMIQEVNVMNECYFLLPVDLTESSIPRWMFESGAVFLHGYDKEGNKLCRWSPSHDKTSSMCVLIALVPAHNSAHLVEACLDC